MRVTFEVQGGASGLQAQFRGQGSYAVRETQKMTRRRAVAHYRRLYDRTPKRTRFMANSIRLILERQDLAYRLGWSPEDFRAENKYPYYRVVLFGSRTQAGNDFFSPMQDEEARGYRAELREILRGGPLGGRR